ncbi:MAG: protein kinase [Candidatus Polarisedimenticolia bacterium]
MIQPGDTLLHYRFEESLGEGGGGVVWRARDTELGRDVAVKLLPDRIASSAEALARLEREARALAALDHPNIVGLHGIEDADGRRLLVMEFVRGRTLDAVIPKSGLPIGPLLDLAVPLADALGAAHAHGVVHRDLKPRNVIVAEDGRPKMIDFGIAAVRPPEPPIDECAAETLTVIGTGPLLGTIPYMAPEQIQGQTADVRADVFSFGVMLHEMATGERPFRGRTAAEIIAAILRDDPESPSTLRPALSPEFDAVVARCLDKDPRGRFPTAVELRDALDGLRRAGPSAAAPGGASLAVLPFEDLSQARDQEYFCDGVAEEIITALGRVAGLRVAARRSSFRFRGAGIDSREIARRLRVGALLEGSVRKAEDRLRVTARLVDGATGFELWSGSYDRELHDVFAIQEEIARAIAAALAVTLSETEHAALGRPPTTDVRAYDLYLRARRFYYQYRRRGVEFARELFERALELDPSFARAWAGVADCHCFHFLYVARVAEHIERAEAASRRALALDPDLAEAQASWGVACSIAGRDEEAVAAFERAVRLDPSLFEARYFYARHSFARGEAEKALRLYEEAEARRPEDYQSPLLMAQIYVDMGRAEDAEATYRRGLRKATAALHLQPDDTRARYMAANALVALGDRERGLEWSRAALAQEPDEPMLLYNVGCIQSMAGEVEEALASLERAVDRGLTQRGWFEHDSNLDPLRAHPRFAALMKRLP